VPVCRQQTRDASEGGITTANLSSHHTPFGVGVWRSGSESPGGKAGAVASFQRGNNHEKKRTVPYCGSNHITSMRWVAVSRCRGPRGGAESSVPKTEHKRNAETRLTRERMIDSRLTAPLYAIAYTELSVVSYTLNSHQSAWTLSLNLITHVRRVGILRLRRVSRLTRLGSDAGTRELAKHGTRNAVHVLTVAL
jgi:hypothetical protein